MASYEQRLPGPRMRKDQRAEAVAAGEEVEEGVAGEVWDVAAMAAKVGNGWIVLATSSNALSTLIS